MSETKTLPLVVQTALKTPNSFMTNLGVEVNRGAQNEVLVSFLGLLKQYGSPEEQKQQEVEIEIKPDATVSEIKPEPVAEVTPEPTVEAVVEAPVVVEKPVAAKAKPGPKPKAAA